LGSARAAAATGLHAAIADLALEQATGLLARRYRPAESA